MALLFIQLGFSLSLSLFCFFFYGRTFWFAFAPLGILLPALSAWFILPSKLPLSIQRRLSPSLSFAGIGNWLQGNYNDGLPVVKQAMLDANPQGEDGVLNTQEAGHCTNLAGIWQVRAPPGTARALKGNSVSLTKTWQCPKT